MQNSWEKLDAIYRFTTRRNKRPERVKFILENAAYVKMPQTAPTARGDPR